MRPIKPGLDVCLVILVVCCVAGAGAEETAGMAHGKGGKASREAGAAAIRDARLEPRNARAGGGSMPDSVAKRRWAPYVAAAICRPGDSYYSSCCCEGYDERDGDVRRAGVAGRVKRTDAIGGNDADRLDRSEPPEANDEDTLFGDLLAAGEPAAQDTASHSKVSPSERRNLCAFCPSGASVFQRSLLVKAFESIASVQYCCPAPSPATPLLVPRAKKPTKVSAARKATHIGLIYDDIDGNGMFTPGIDKPLPKKWVVLRSEGKVIAQIRTDGLGRYFFVGKAKPWTLLSVSLLRNPSNILDRIQTGRLGDTRALVAIPPPKLKGSAFYDLDLDGQKSATDKPATAIKLRVEFANGTIWKEVSTDANGKFGFIYHRRMPYKKLLLTTGNGKAKKQVQLDADGNGKGALAIPEKSGAVFSERRSTG